MKLLEGKTAIITGASRGIGKAVALEFARQGANIAFTDLRYDEIAQETEKEIAALGVKAKMFASNAADFSDLHTIIYGHNMKNGSMFAGLKNYSDQSYAEAHPYIYVDLADGSHCYEIFSAHEADATDITYTIGYRANDTYASFLDSLKTASLYDTGVEVGK